MVTEPLPEAKIKWDELSEDDVIVQVEVEERKSQLKQKINRANKEIALLTQGITKWQGILDAATLAMEKLEDKLPTPASGTASFEPEPK